MLIKRYETNKPFLQKSKFRSSFVLDEKDKAYIAQKGMETMNNHAVEFITKRLAPMKPAKDGKQTPYSGHPVFKAQHATGTCCRKCLEKWYSIPKGTELDQEQIHAISGILTEWIKEQI